MRGATLDAAAIRIDFTPVGSLIAVMIAVTIAARHVEIDQDPKGLEVTVDRKNWRYVRPLLAAAASSSGCRVSVTATASGRRRSVSRGCELTQYQLERLAQTAERDDPRVVILNLILGRIPDSGVSVELTEITGMSRIFGAQAQRAGV